MKKKSYGNIHSLKDRAYHEVTMSPTSSPTLQRRSLAVPPTFPLRALMASEPILEEEPSLRGLGSGSITHGNEMSFQDFADLFKIFSIRLRKDIRDIFKTHSVSLRKIGYIYANDSSIPPSDKNTDSRFKIASITRNNPDQPENIKRRAERIK